MHQMSQEMEEGMMMMVTRAALENLSRNQNLVAEKMMIMEKTEKARKKKVVKEEKAIKMNLMIV